MKEKTFMILCVALVIVWVSGCATTEPSKPAPYKLTSQGTVIWEDEFEFSPPPTDWKLLRVEAGENSLVSPVGRPVKKVKIYLTAARGLR